MTANSTYQAELFPRLIKSIEYDEENIISDILKLHSKDGIIDLDPTYSKGVFYSGRLAAPKLKFDIMPQLDSVREADCRNLPIKSSSLNCIMFDPPFIINNEKNPDNKMQNRFSGFRYFHELISMYDDSLKEFYRILKKKGIVIFKCQDVCNGNMQYFSHCKVMELAIKNNLYPKDLFVYIKKNRMIGKYTNQHHARKFHSYFWVFEKRKFSVNYQFA